MSEEVTPLTPAEITEFNEAMLAYLTHHDSSRLEELFRLFDRNHNGSLSELEIKTVMEQVSGHGFSDQQVHEIIRSADKNSDGSIDIREFISVMKRLTD
ncbi:unnamed protein product [Blepharisma stoltei]|uniref:EF-hand domain-containing protein n=1 Tax=Blepharisma stoltei TaxID=1481888 RepID=A0AAU9JI50_9CILI|nr:unnamed protein product [Blepharisma stoltei]